MAAVPGELSKQAPKGFDLLESMRIRVMGRKRRLDEAFAPDLQLNIRAPSASNELQAACKQQITGPLTRARLQAQLSAAKQPQPKPSRQAPKVKQRPSPKQRRQLQPVKNAANNQKGQQVDPPRRESPRLHPSPKAASAAAEPSNPAPGTRKEHSQPQQQETTDGRQQQVSSAKSC